MLLDLDNTRISHVVVGTGGFLDLGEKKVLVPWNMLTLETETGAATDAQPNAFILQSHQETFNNAPEVDLDTVLPKMGQPANDWDVDINAYWESGGATNAPSTDATATTDPGTGEATATAGTDQGQATATPGTDDQGQGGVADLQGVMLASELLGASITLSPGQGQGQGQGVGQAQATAAPEPGGQATATPDTTGLATATADTGQGSGQGVGNFSGTVDDAIVEVDTGDILFLVINTTLDEGERWIPVPLGFFEWDSDNNALLLNTTPALIREAPFFEDGLFPDTAQDGWNSEFDTFWQNNTPGTGG
jgi:hypothetical protein